MLSINMRQAYVLIALLVIAPFSSAFAEPTNAQKLDLKVTVLNHIRAHTTGGTYYFVGEEDTKLKELKFIAMHPVVFEREDGTFALCADFQDASNKKYLIDYFVRHLNGKYVVLASLEGKRSLLMSMAQKFGL